jgi:prevent-host-death family protein
LESYLAIDKRAGYISYMKRANVAELKNRLSHYLSRVKRGETVLVMERATPIARIVPAAPPSQMSSDETEAWLKRLETNGVLRLGARKGLQGVIGNVPPGRRPVGAVKTLLEDRERR